MMKLAPATLLAGAVFTSAWLVLGMISPGFTLFGRKIAPYSWIAQPVSGLGLGKTGPWMNAAFLVTASLLALGIAGALSGLPGLSQHERLVYGALLMLSPVGVATCGLFTLESFMPHLLGFLVAMGAAAVGFAALGWRLHHEAGRGDLGAVLLIGGGLTAALLVLSLATFDPVRSGEGLGFAGLTQRILITEVLAVFALLGVVASRGAPA